MRTLYFTLVALCLPAWGMAQGIMIGGGSGGGIFTSSGSGSVSGSGGITGRPVGIGSLQANLHSDPPGALPRGMTSSFHGSNGSGDSFFSRSVFDGVNHVYYGYELILEEQQPGTYLATFGKLGITPMEAAASVGSNWRQWSMRPLPSMPEPKVVHDGATFSIELMTDASTGLKLIDDIEIHPFSPRPLGLPAVLPNRQVAGRGGPTIPTVSGTARDFSAVDAEMRITQPRITINGDAQSTATRGLPNTTGSLVWFYLPGRGRYILSIAPREDLDFKLVGEVRGGAITFTLGEDSIKLECPTPIATGDAPYNLYVLRDPEWEPTAQAQKGQFAVGSVSPGELAGLKRQ